MKIGFTLVALLVLAAPALADDGRIPQNALSRLGLGGMQVVSDAQGMQVRGISSNAVSGGTSLIVAQLVFNDANGTQFIIVSDVNTSRSTSENAGLNATSSATHSQGSGVIITLGPIINAAGLQFSGVASGQAGQVTFPGFAGSGFALAF
jgi:hypothetical protein